MPLDLLIAAAGGLLAGGLLLGAFPSQARLIVDAVKGALGKFIEAVVLLTNAARKAVWDAVKPAQPPDAVRAIFGVFVLAAAGKIVHANYQQLQPTIEFILPVANARDSLTISIVGLGVVLGLLWHLATGERGAVRVLASALIATVTLLTWVRTASLLDEPDYPLLMLVSGLAGLLQFCEIVAVRGGMHLAGAVAPAIVALPLMCAIGVVWLPFRILSHMEAHEKLASILDAVVLAAESALTRLRLRLAKLSPTAIHAARHERQLQDLRNASQVGELQTGLDEARVTEALTRASRMAEFREAEAHAREGRNAMRAIQRKAAEEIMGHIAGHSTQMTLQFMKQSEPEFQAQAKTHLALAAPEVGDKMSAATRAIFRIVGLFNGPGNGPQPPSQQNNDQHPTVN
jgi:hypothetical protein